MKENHVKIWLKSWEKQRNTSAFRSRFGISTKVILPTFGDFQWPLKAAFPNATRQARKAQSFGCLVWASHPWTAWRHPWPGKWSIFWGEIPLFTIWSYGFFIFIWGWEINVVISSLYSIVNMKCRATGKTWCIYNIYGCIWVMVFSHEWE